VEIPEPQPQRHQVVEVRHQLLEQIEILQMHLQARNKRYVMRKQRSLKVILQHMEKRKIV
jgi:hypothetical protein